MHRKLLLIWQILCKLIMSIALPSMSAIRHHPKMSQQGDVMLTLRYILTKSLQIQIYRGVEVTGPMVHFLWMSKVCIFSYENKSAYVSTHLQLFFKGITYTPLHSCVTCPFRATIVYQRTNITLMNGSCLYKNMSTNKSTFKVHVCWQFLSVLY